MNVTMRWSRHMWRCMASLPGLKVALTCCWRPMQVDVTEIFRQIPHEKKVRMVSLLVYLCTFVITIYKCARPGQSFRAAASMHACSCPFYLYLQDTSASFVMLQSLKICHFADACTA